MFYDDDEDDEEEENMWGVDIGDELNRKEVSYYEKDEDLDNNSLSQLKISDNPAESLRLIKDFYTKNKYDFSSQEIKYKAINVEQVKHRVGQSPEITTVENGLADKWVYNKTKMCTSFDKKSSANYLAIYKGVAISSGNYVIQWDIELGKF